MMGLLGRTMVHSARARSALLAVLVAAGPVSSHAEPRHGLSIFGELKYAADFKNFDYVNPDAPKGGRITTNGTPSFDTLNPFIVKGDKPIGLDLLFDTLMTRAQDERDAVYGLIAKSADVAPDRMSVTFNLRPEAKFSDGSPVTAEDVAFSFKLLKEKGVPEIALSLRDVVSADAVDPATVRYTFTGTLVRDLPVLVAQLPVLSKAYYGAHPFDETTLTPPLGSGPYDVKEVVPASSITYKRRDNYWAKDLPVNRGKNNFDEIRIICFRDRTAELENLKSGELDFREEFTSVNWATGYDIPAVKDGRLIKETLPDERPSGAQGFFINTRRDKFKDVRVRAALDYLFDFESSNKNLFYGLYTRTTSFFENSDMKATGKPSPEELALLEPFKDKLLPEVFAEPYTPPVTDASGNIRENQKKARAMLIAAGWTIGPDRLLHGAKGETLDIEFLSFEPMFERIIQPILKNMQEIGINASLRMVDSAQYERRMKSFDFDVTTERYALNMTPGADLRVYWGSAAAKLDGSRNLAGISEPAIDALIERVIAAQTRAELVTATHAIDRVLRAGHYWVPHWYKAAHNIVYWNKYSRPATKPKYDLGVVETWWFDSSKAAALSSAKAGR